ncbi:hypothetical protein ACOSP7_020593 [Xanthoceras sorbifolium]
MAQADFHKSKKETMWFLDSSCSNHMTGDRQWFLHLDESFRQVVKLESIKLRVNGTSQVITEVFYCPELQNNLLSIGQLQEHNLAILIQHEECKIYHYERGLIIFGHLNFKGLRTLSYKKMVKGMPPLNGTSVVCTVCMVGKQH